MYEAPIHTFSCQLTWHLRVTTELVKAYQKLTYLAATVVSHIQVTDLKKYNIYNP